MSHDRANERLIGVILENGSGSFFTAEIVYDFAHGSYEYDLEKIDVDPQRFACNWSGPSIAVSASKILKFTSLGLRSARIEFIDGDRKSVDITGAPPQLLSALQKSLLSAA